MVESWSSMMSQMEDGMFKLMEDLTDSDHHRKHRRRNRPQHHLNTNSPHHHHNLLDHSPSQAGLEYIDDEDHQDLHQSAYYLPTSSYDNGDGGGTEAWDQPWHWDGLGGSSSDATDGDASQSPWIWKALGGTVKKLTNTYGAVNKISHGTRMGFLNALLGNKYQRGHGGPDKDVVGGYVPSDSAASNLNPPTRHPHQRPFLVDPRVRRPPPSDQYSSIPSPPFTNTDGDNNNIDDDGVGPHGFYQSSLVQFDTSPFLATSFQFPKIRDARPQFRPSALLEKGVSDEDDWVVGTPPPTTEENE